VQDADGARSGRSEGGHPDTLSGANGDDRHFSSPSIMLQILQRDRLMIGWASALRKWIPTFSLRPSASFLRDYGFIPITLLPSLEGKAARARLALSLASATSLRVLSIVSLLDLIPK
jgi:hypothetical protein